MTTEMEPQATGVPGLDLLLAGGLNSNPLVAVIGPTGAGKTVLASQILFHAVQRGTPSLILTAYSEDQTKLLAHLRAFTFFNAQAIGQAVTLLAFPSLQDMQVATAVAPLVRLIRESGAGMVLIDGFQGIAAEFNDVMMRRRLLAALAAQLTYYQVTVLLTLTGNVRHDPDTMGLTSADVVLGLHYRLEGRRHHRDIEVIKQRGRDHLAGAHSYSLTRTGVTIFPRVETRALLPLQPRPTGRVPFQIAELDHLMHGGPTAGSVTLLVGGPGVGKTTLGLAWALATATPTSGSIFLNFEEQLPELQAKAAMLGLPLEAAQASGAFTFLHLSPVELNPDELAERLLAALTPTTQRVVIDSIRVLEHVLGPRMGDYLAALLLHLYQAAISTLLLLEIKPFAGLQFDLMATPSSLVSDNVMIVQQVVAQGVIRRVLAVLKMRFSEYDATLRELIINAQGVRVLTAQQSTAVVLDAVAEASSLTAPPAEEPLK